MLENIYKYVEQALRSFDNDPADSKFQEGYQAALEDVKQQLDFLLEE